jgi:hypothetical protein
MHGNGSSTTHPRDLVAPERNHYFFGKLLDVYHFELETGYLNGKRWLLNRLVAGYGVVCGLDVRPADDPKQIVVSRGVAIDKWGREIIVPHKTRPLHVPVDLVDRAGQSCGQDEHPCVSVWLCYHECLSDPVPVMAGDCHGPDACAPGTVREQYRIEFREECVPELSPECRLSHVFGEHRIDYGALAKWVTRGCPEIADDPCIPLANIRFPRAGGYSCHPDNIDVTIRPIVYTNDLLFELLLGFLGESSEQRRAK